MMKTFLALSMVSVVGAVSSCRDTTSTAGVTPVAAPNSIAVSQSQASNRPWVTLFDGGDPAKNWRGFKKESVPTDWTVEDGCLVHSGKGGGDLVTRQSYGSFEFELEWKLAPGGNSGIMYHVSEDANNTWETGPEMQILDDSIHVDGKDRLTCAGSDYALYPAPIGAVKPIGEWNRIRMLVEGMHIQYWLNGVKTADFIRGSDDWKRRVAESKFSKMPRYATNSRGHIALQDHGDRVWFRNIRVKPLD